MMQQYDNKINTINWFDLDGVLWFTDAKWWIVDKKNPENFIIKISQYEGSLILSGHYKSQKLQIHYNGSDGWLSKEIYEKILKKKDISLDDIGFSWREFSDTGLISKQIDSLRINTSVLKHLDPDKDIVNVLTARGNKEAHRVLLKKLEDELSNNGIDINECVFIHDVNNTNIAGNAHTRKCLYLLQNIVGYKIDGNKFVPIKCQEYDVSNFYDDQDININECYNINTILSGLLNNTMKTLRDLIINDIYERKPVLNVNLVTTNEMNPFETEQIKIYA